MIHIAQNRNTKWYAHFCSSKYYISYQDSNFYACLNKDQPSVNLEDDITYSEFKIEVIVFGDINAHTRSFI